MPIFNNLLTSVILAPALIALSALSLSTIPRAIEWISMIAKTPQKGYMRDIKPFVKQLDAIIERILGENAVLSRYIMLYHIIGNKFSVSATNILLMTVIILLLSLLLEGGEKPKKVQVVEKKKPITTALEKQE